MKSRIMTTLLLILTAPLMLTLMVGTGCRTIATPTFPLTNTPTFTITQTPTSTPNITATFTNTKTNTGTFTSTGTPTNTATQTLTSTPGSPTMTPTITNTSTVTDTPTSTSTNTITNTPGGAATNTPTVTPTPTYCTAASVQTTYTFESSTDCMHPDASNTIVTNSGLSGTQKHSGSSSYFMAINNTSGSASNAQFEITYSPVANLSGATVTLYIYLDPGLAGCSGFQVADQNTGCSWDSTWVNAPATGSWLQVTFTPSTAGCSNASTPVNVTQLVFQLTGVPNGASGNLYVDDLTITLPAGPTATPTATATAAAAYSFYFDGGSIPAGWSVIPTGAVTLSGLTLETPGYNASAGAMGATITWSATGQSVNFQYNYSSVTNWTALGITGMRAMVMVNPLMDTGGGNQLYCQSGPTYAWENSNWSNEPPANTWVQISWVPPFTAGGSNPVSIQQFGIQFASGGTASAFNTDTVFVDSVELY